MNSSLHANDSNRRRTLSESSGVSVHTIDCDVVPRGTIYLLGSTVEANEALTLPEEDLYALTITDHENGNHCHLAARTTEARDQWIQKIRSVCQSETGAPAPSAPNRVPYSPQTPMPKRKTETRILASSKKSQPPTSSQQNGARLKDKENAAEKDLSGERNSARDIEVLVVFSPVVLYKILTMTSIFGLATFGFIVASILAVRWIVIQQFLKVARPLTSSDEDKKSLGYGTICCRLTEKIVHICGSGSAASLPHILVWALAKGIRQQPILVSKRYNLLPPFYSTDVAVLDMSQKKSYGTLVSKADDRNLDEIADCFDATKQQVGFLQQMIGPACQIVMKSGDSEQIQLELSLAERPITVFVSCTTKAATISINFQSTDVLACRKFTEDFQKSIRSAKV